jgi:acetoacetyl-CoA reductase
MACGSGRSNQLLGSQGGRHRFHQGAGAELAAKNVTVNAICPGYVATQMVMAIKPEILQSIIDTVPMKRLAKPEEIGGACVYLASDIAGFMTGSTLNICGGLYYQ